jgi:hypothetical protein
VSNYSNADFQVFGLLDPLDILRLSRTTKALRNMLMCRSAVSVWRAAFTHEPELPPIPDGLNEPQWANLVFSNHCHASPSSVCIARVQLIPKLMAALPVIGRPPGIVGISCALLREVHERTVRSPVELPHRTNYAYLALEQWLRFSQDLRES